MIKDSKNLKKIDEKAIIWRYMDFASFYRLVMTNKIYFRRLDKYSDKLEGILPPETQNELYRYRLNFPFTTSEEAEIWTKNEVTNIENFKAWTLSNSWIINDSESYAMWKIYCPENGISIKSTIGKLKSSFEKNDFEIYIGAIDYGVVKKQNLNQFTVSTNKREYYSYENEVRAFMINQFDAVRENDKNRWIPKYNDGIEVPIDLSLLIDSIYISPFAGRWLFECVNDLRTDKFNFLSMEKLILSEIMDK
jgi:hypothetical protein